MFVKVQPGGVGSEPRVHSVASEACSEAVGLCSSRHELPRASCLAVWTRPRFSADTDTTQNPRANAVVLDSSLEPPSSTRTGKCYGRWLDEGWPRARGAVRCSALGRRCAALHAILPAGRQA